MGDVKIARHGHDDIYPPESPCKVSCFIAPGWDAYKDDHINYSSESNWNCSCSIVSLISRQLTIVNTRLEKQPVQDVAMSKTIFL
jgi:hypothetical protein